MLRIIYVLLLCACVNRLPAISAYPYRIPVTIDGQTVNIQLFGDEYVKWAETIDGHTLVQKNDNKWWYAKQMPDGDLQASAYTYSPALDKSAELLKFLKETPKHLRPLKTPVQTEAKPVAGSAIGERRVLVILMEYRDLGFSKSRDDFEHLFNQVNYNEDGALGSVRDYYLSASYGQLELHSDIYGPYTATYDMEYYGNNDISGQDINPFELFEQAIKSAAEEVDLKLYDGNGDGFLDNVHIIYAGYGEEAGGKASAIWAHESTFSQPYEIKGLKIDRYSCAPELRGNSGKGISRIGPHCHEIGHALGAKDYYDTNYETNGQYTGTGQWDVMGQGSWNNDGITPADFNPYVKAFDYGWISPRTLPEGQVVLKPSCDTPDYYILCSSENEDYYLLENRSLEKWGGGLPGQGLLVYHVDPDLVNVGNKINVSSRQKCYLVCASSNTKKPTDKPSSYGDINSPGCPYPGSSGNSSFSSFSQPMAFYWSGEDCGINLQEITLLPDGDIVLVNDSKGTGYEPQELTTLYEESFESAGQFNLVETSAEGWTVVKDPKDDLGLLDRPQAHSGNSCLQLSAKDQYWNDIESSIEFECRSEHLTGNAIVSGYYTSFGLTGKIANTLMIGYQTEAGEWEYSELRSSTNITWNSFTFSFPLSAGMKFRVKGIAKAGTILAIDDISVAAQTAHTNIERNNIISRHDGETKIYSLTGYQLHQQSKGLNIIRMKNGQYIKIFIK